MKTIADRVNSLILREGVTIGKAAERCSVPPPRLYDICSGKTKNPASKTVTNIAKGLNSTETFILQGIEDSPIVAETPAAYPDTISPYIKQVTTMMASMDEDMQKDICLSVEKEKLLRDLLRQKDSDEKAG